MKQIKKMVDISSMSRKEIEEYAMKLSTQMEAMEAKLSWYEEQLRLNRQKRFGASSEKITIDQMSFFNEAESEYNESLKEPKVGDIKPPTTKKKQKGHKDKITRPLPKEVIDYVLTDDEMICPVCGEMLHEMKKEIRKEITIIPARYVVKEHVVHTYSCRSCETNGTSATIVKAKSPKPLFRNCLASASLLADIMVKKYMLSLPLYRQEQSLKLEGLRLSRQTMANWVVNASDRYLKSLYDLMHRDLLTRDIIHADETELEVLREPGRPATAKSYMWLYRTSGCDFERPIVLYEYQPSRNGDNARSFLKGFSGYLQTDAYSGYNKVIKACGKDEPIVIPIGCLAHARRKFDEALKAIPQNTDKKTSQSIIGLEYCNKLFEIEKYAKEQELSYDEITKLRKEKALPVFEEFLSWAKRLYDESLPKSLLGEALKYLINQEQSLKNYILDGRLEITNNRAERSIKPFVIGRKNWLFSNTPKGAQASAIVYSIMESAKEAGLKPFEYFTYLFEVLPNLDSMDEETVKSLLPYSQSIPDSIRVTE